MDNIDNKASVASLRVEKTVTIFRKDSNSSYVRRNAKMMPESKNRIGSAINSVDRMKANLPELAVYMPSIIGCSSSDPKYTERLDNWFNNISKIVLETGLPLDIGFVYEKAEYKENIQAIEKEIFDTFTKARKTTVEERDLAFKIRDEATINLEGTKYKYGFPTKVGDYILWRYCLVYSAVANDIALINKTGAIRFYMYDPTSERYKEELLFNLRKKAAVAYVKLMDEPSKVTDILWMHLGENTDVSKFDELAKYKAIETLYKVNPEELLRYYEDTALITKARVERMIHFGILRRLSGTNVIVDENNDIIGNNIGDVLAFFRNSEHNKAAITRFNSKLNNYTNG